MQIFPACALMKTQLPSPGTANFTFDLMETELREFPIDNHFPVSFQQVGLLPYTVLVTALLSRMFVSSFLPTGSYTTIQNLFPTVMWIDYFFVIKKRCLVPLNPRTIILIIKLLPVFDNVYASSLVRFTAQISKVYLKM